jgi:biotin operon repressor
LARTPPGGKLLISVRTATPSLERAAEHDPRLLLVALAERRVWVDGLEIRLEDSSRLPSLNSRRGRKPFGKFAVLRALLLAAEPLPQKVLSELTGISQPAVSKALNGLDDQTQRTPHGWRLTSAPSALSETLDQYPGPGGITTYWWTDTSLEAQAAVVRKALDHAGNRVLVSGDLAADAISPWRTPEHALVYAETGVDAARLGFAAADIDDYTLAVTVPEDRTVWATAALTGLTGLVDPIIAAFDLLRSGRTGDEAESAERIRQDVLRRFDARQAEQSGF